MRTTSVTVGVYPFSVFVVPVPFHEAVPKHTIISQEEFQKQLKGEYIKITDIPHISVRDPPVIWLGGKIGQIVMIERNSQTAAKAIVYRLIC